MSKKVSHHAYAAKLLALVVGWLVVGLGGLCGSIVLASILIQEAKDNLPPETWWVFWPLVGVGLIYWFGWELSREQEARDRAEEERRVAREVAEAYDTLGN